MVQCKVDSARKGVIARWIEAERSCKGMGILEDDRFQPHLLSWDFIEKSNYIRV